MLSTNWFSIELLRFSARSEREVESELEEQARRCLDFVPRVFFMSLSHLACVQRFEVSDHSGR